MAKTHIETDTYTLDVDETSGDVHLSLTFKRPQHQQPSVPPSRQASEQAHHVIIPATDQHRRQGIFEDEVVVHSKGEGFYEIESRTEPGAWHVVHVTEDGSESCTCVSHQFRRLCRHLRAVRLLQGRSTDAPLSARDMAGDDLTVLASYPAATEMHVRQEEVEA